MALPCKFCTGVRNAYARLRRIPPPPPPKEKKK